MGYRFEMKSSILIGVLIIAAHSFLRQAQSSLQSKSVPKCEKFQARASGEIIDGEATKAGFRTVRSSKTHLGFTLFEACGETMTMQYGEFSSPQDAEQYFDWNVNKASKILSQGPKVGSNGEQVGYRAEVILQSENQQAVIWTNVAMFRIIFSRSLINALELERRYANFNYPRVCGRFQGEHRKRSGWVSYLRRNV